MIRPWPIGERADAMILADRQTFQKLTSALHIPEGPFLVPMGDELVLVSRDPFAARPRRRWARVRHMFQGQG